MGVNSETGVISFLGMIKRRWQRIFCAFGVLGDSSYGIPFTFFIFAFCFWLPRLYYWNSVFEEPFSDMADYIQIARNILSDMNFGISEFWKTYKPPTLPTALAGFLFLFGDHGLVWWRVFVATICFFGVWLLSREVLFSCKRQWIGFALCLIVALSKSSIFWSYKVSTESLAEALGYWTMWLAMRATREPSKVIYFCLGALLTVAVLNRPQFLLAGIFILLGIQALIFIKGPDKLSGNLRRSLISSGLIGGAMLVVWSPWLIRNYRLYDNIVPFSTQGPYSFMWELDDISVLGEKDVVKTNINKLYAEAETNFENDYLASRHADAIAKQWLFSHKREFGEIYLRRLKSMLFDRSIYLTKLSRQQLLPGIWNNFLLDKSRILSLLGLVGLIFLFRFGSNLFFISFVFLGNWWFSCLFLGYPRMLEPYMPLLLFGSVALISIVFDAWKAISSKMGNRGICSHLD